MPLHDELGVRMKSFYEEIPKTKLMRRTPVIIRIDGKAFHTFTKNFERPFDEVFIQSMQDTAKYLCGNIQGAVLSYQQSDEISLLLIDYKKLNSAAWFDYEVQKMCSIAASMATAAFNEAFSKNAEQYLFESYFKRRSNEFEYRSLRFEPDPRSAVYKKALIDKPMFDARCFNIPKEEVTNYFYWRQLDASRNSIQMVGQANFSHKKMQGKSNSEIQDMLMAQKGINWNDYPIHQKRGSCCIKRELKDAEVDGGTLRRHWIIDKEIPIFKGDGRDYIEKLVWVGE